MASTFSDLKIELIATGEQSGTWGSTTNANLGTAIEQAITGTGNVPFSSADVTLTLTDTNASQTARNLRLNLTGTSGGARNLIVPAIEKQYIVNNGLADAVTIKNATGTGVIIPAGKTMVVFNNATDVVDVVTHSSSLTIGSALATASGGTGQSAYTDGQLLIGNTATTGLTKATLTAGSGVSITNGNGSISIAATGSGGTVSTVSVVSANGLAGTVANATTTPAITLSTSVTGVLKGDGTSISAATAGTDYAKPDTISTWSANQSFNSGNLLLKGATSGSATLNAPAIAATNTYTLPANATTLGYINIPQSGAAKTGSYGLATTDVGQTIIVGTGGSITIPDATFAAGDAVLIFNNTSAGITITCTITTAYIAGTDTDKATLTLATRGIASILFISGTICVVSGNVS